MIDAPPIRVVESTILRSPLGLRLVDPVRGATVSAGVRAVAWPLGDPSVAVTSVISPISGIHGFTSLPGLRDFEVGRRPASDWCGSPPAGPNFGVAIDDSLGRFLPQVLSLCLPRERLTELVLFSAPSRPVPGGLAVVRGQLTVSVTGLPAAWAVVSANVADVAPVTTVADARGMFLLAMPHAEALPPLPSSLPGSPSEEISWPITLQVRCQPSTFAWLAGAPSDAPPDTRTLLAQGVAQVRDVPGTAVASLSRVLRFGHELVVRTTGRPDLMVDPA